ncbi:MAG: phospholipid carrier-dependent glycosyltransferase [Nitrospirae bacterium]|nr:phospholipid carrier-dependent glycosyltransferase [Nitrospirota bacterium]
MLARRGRPAERVTLPLRTVVINWPLTMPLLEDSQRGEALRILSLVALCLFLFGFGLHSRVLWDVDEGMHAVMTRNILLTGDWVTPTFNGENFYDKPILFNWLGAIAFLLFGFNEFAARLPASIFGTCGVLVTYFLGRKMFGPTVGFLGGVILAGSAEYLLLSRVVVHDIALTLFTTLALSFFYFGLVDVERRKRYLLLFWVAAGFAILAKGPLGLALPGLVIGVFLLATRRVSLIREMQIGWGLLILLAVAGPWYFAISLRNPDYLRYFILEKNLGSFTSTDTHHAGPIYFYFRALAFGLLPWVTFVPLAMVGAIRNRDRGPGDAVLFLLIWAGAIFAFFSLATAKLESYILPLFPAVALLFALYWNDALTDLNPSRRRGLLWSWSPLVGLMVAAVIYLWLVPPSSLQAKAGLDPPRVYGFIWTIAALVILVFFLLWFRKTRAAMVAIVVLVAANMVLFNLVLAPSVGPYRATKELGLRLDQRLPPGERYVFYNRIRDSAMFYADREALVLENPTELQELLESDKREFCILDERRLKEVDGLKELFFVLDQDGNKYLISNRPDP